MAAISFQQNIVRVVHLEVVQGGPLNTLIPNTCLQQPMSGESGLPPNIIYEFKRCVFSKVLKGKFSSGLEGALASPLNRDFN